MKKIICIIITATLVLTSATTAFAKPSFKGEQQNSQQTTKYNSSFKSKKQQFKLKASPVIKYGRFSLPIKPIQAMGATVTFDKETAILTVVKGTITIVIDLKNKTVTNNGVADTNSGIFTAKSSKKNIVLIKYIAKALGIRTMFDKDKITVEVPGLDLPTNVTVTPVSSSAIVANTLNSTTLFMTASANIKPGQATGGKAELYVGTKLVAKDDIITATDSSLQFTTSDETPTNAELQVAVPVGGLVTVKLYNADNKYVRSSVANPTLIVDYETPTITGFTSAVYNVADNKLYLGVNGVRAIGDKVDVTRISLFDTILAKTYQLTNTPGTGSNGVVGSESILVINIGSADKLALVSYGNTTSYLTISVGSLLSDAAGNTSPGFTSAITIPVTIIK
jgi:hypothetical protein